MQLDIVLLSMECVAGVVPEEIIVPDIRVRNGRIRGADMSANELLRKIGETAQNTGSSESGFLQLYEMAKQYFDSISGDARMAGMEMLGEMKQQISYINNLLAKSSFDLAGLYKCRRDGFQQEKYALLQEKSAIFAELEQENKQYKDYIDKSNALEKRRAQLVWDIAGYMAEIMKARRDLDNIHHKQDELRKWCWVPFYNIHLLIDAENAMSHFNSCQQQIDIAQKNYDALIREKGELQRSIMEMAGMEHKIKERIDINEHDMQTCIQNINNTESKALQCSDIALYFGKINKTLEFSDDTIVSIDAIVSEIKRTLKKFLVEGQALFSNSPMM